MIEYPPSRIIYHGKMTKEKKDFVIRCLSEMHKRPYRNYEFKESVSFVGGITTSRQEIDSDNICVNCGSSK
jgi:hypothetical protein